MEGDHVNDGSGIVSFAWPLIKLHEVLGLEGLRVIHTRLLQAFQEFWVLTRHL